MNLDTLEESIEKPGYLLFVVSILLLLIIGWVNLISVQSETPTLFNYFSIPQAIFFGLYTIGLIRWAMLLRHPNDDAWFVGFLQQLQDRPIVGLAVLGALGIVLASMFIPTRLMDIWLFYPALVACFIIAFLIIMILILAFRNDDPTRPKIWRWLAWGALAVLAVELLLQAGSLIGVTPITTSLRDPIGPYDRIYYVNSAGEVVNNIANEHGWHYPEFRLEDDSHVIALSGDVYVKGFDLPAEANMGVLLDGWLADDPSLNNPEVISLGFPDFDTGLYLSDTTIGHNHEVYQFQDLITFFDLKDDFQTVTEPSDEAFYYYEEDGELVLHPGSRAFRHDAAHYTLWYSDGIKPNRVINSHVMLARLAQRLAQSPSTAAKVPAPQDDVPLENSFMFYTDSDDNGHFIVDKQLEKLVSEVIDPFDISMLMVTIPPFTAPFYAQSGSNWSTEFGDADLFLPERELRKTAEKNRISFLAMGEYMRAKGMSTAEIQALFMDDGLGTFTAEGHMFFAQAVHDCFYSQTLDSSDGCDLRK